MIVTQLKRRSTPLSGAQTLSKSLSLGPVLEQMGRASKVYLARRLKVPAT
jgi:hypothetical protein